MFVVYWVKLPIIQTSHLNIPIQHNNTIGQDNPKPLRRLVSRKIILNFRTFYHNRKVALATKLAAEIIRTRSVEPELPRRARTTRERQVRLNSFNCSSHAEGEWSFFHEEITKSTLFPRCRWRCFQAVSGFNSHSRSRAQDCRTSFKINIIEIR